MKKITRVICVMAFCLVAMMGMSNVSNAATVGKALANPETGWQRINDTDSNFVYSGGWHHDSRGDDTQYNKYRWNNNVTACAGGSESVLSFSFYGSKLRVIGETHTSRSENNIIIIDGVESTFSEYSTAGSYMALIYEKTGLTLGVHTVLIKTSSTMSSSQFLLIDAIDIDSTGYLINPYSLKANAGNKKIDLSWNDNAIEGATKYIIKRSTTAGGPYIQIGTSTTNSFADTDVVNGTTYYYVICVDDFIDDSNEVSATPKAETKKLKVVLEAKEQLQLSVDEDLSENANATWISSDTAVATVDANGVVTALKPGNTVVTASSEEESYSESINILVMEDATDYRLAVDLKVGKTCRLTVDDGLDTAQVNWTSTDSTIATVSSKGKVNAVSEGLTIVTATDADGNEIGQVYVRVRV
ncbi:MAG: Ig-like domain-containing protein [Velocimicrobium sp.]